MCFFIQKVQAQLVANFTADMVAGCAPIRVVFSDASTGNPTDWSWNLGNGTIAEHTSSPSTTYLTGGTYTVKLTVYKGTDSATVIKTNYITVYSVPKIDFSALPLTGCTPVTVNFADISIPGTPGAATYQWDFGDGNIGAGKNPSHTYYSAGSFKVTLTIKNSAGCSASDSRLNYITTYDSVRAHFSIKAPSVCSVPATYGFIDSSIGTVTKHFWDFGDGGTSTQINPSHTYNTAGPFTVKLVVQNANGCTDTIIKTNAISPGNFKADFTFPATACVGKGVGFTNTSSPAAGLDSSRWSFGDGKISGSTNPANTYAAAGSYNVRLIAWFGKCSDTTIKPIVIQPQPVAKFTGSPTGSCNPPLTVKFNNATVGGTVVKWDFGNGQTSAVANPTVTYTDYGSYDVTLIVKNLSGCADTLVQKGFVNINKPQVTGITGLPYQGCMPFTGAFGVAVNSPEPVTGYQWDFGDGTSSTSANPTHSFSDTTTYNVRVIITTSSGCVDTFKSEVHGGLRPKANFTGAPNFICPEMPVNFSSLSSSTANGWFWRFGDGGTSDLENPSYLYKDTGWMNVSLVAYNNGCGDSIQIDKYIYVNPPIPAFDEFFSCSDPFTYSFQDHSKGGESWKWYLDVFDSAVGKTAAYTFPDTGSYKITLVVQDSSCINKATHVVQVINEKAAFAVSDSGICGLAYKRFRAEGPQTHPANIVRYEWDFGDGKTAITDTPVVDHVYSKNGPVKVRLIITDIKGCNDTTVVPMNIQVYGPTADFTPPSSGICAGSVMTFFDASLYDSTFPIVSWEWIFGNGIDTVFTKEPFETVYPDPGVYDVKLIVIDSAGCRGAVTKRKAVTVLKPVADFFSPDTVICVNTPAAFTNLSSGVQLKYYWSFGNGKKSTVPDPSTTYDSLGKYDVQLIVKDSLNCRDTLLRPKYISVEQTIADFSISDSFTTCPPLVVSFTNQSVNSLDNKWTFGNGNSSSLESPTHTYTTSGIFTATLVATGNGGCSDSATRTITIQGPSGKFTYAPLGGCPPLTVNFEATTKNTTNITWDFSDGESTVTADTTATHIYRLPGFYVPKAIVADNLGCKLPIQGLDTIRVIGAKAFIRSIPSYSYCDSVTLQLFDSTITADVIKSYKWDFGDGTGSNQRNPVHTYKKEGRYVITFEVQTSSGCVSTDTLAQPVIISRTPAFVIGFDSSVCVPATIQYNAVWSNRDTSNISWHWTFGNGQTSSKLVPDPVLYQAPGKYSVQLIGTNFYGCADTLRSRLLVNDTPDVVAGPASYLCLGQKLTLNVTGGVSYRWNNNNTLSCLSCQSPVASPLNQQLYRVTATDSNGCKASDDVLVKVKAPGNLSVGPGDTLCVGESFTLHASGMELYSWSPATGLSATNIADPVAKPLQTTRYQLLATDSLNCFPDSGYVDIVVYPIPQFNILEDNITALTGTVMPLETTSSPDIIFWHWTPPVGLSCTNCATPVLTVGNSITYTAVVRNLGDCQALDRVTITPVCDSKSVYIPNTFSPNSDGKNDFFYPRGNGAALVKSMRIFNRWGELLYDKKDFALNDPFAGWDGTYKGAVLTPDVYIYLIDILCDSKVVFNLKGNVTLLR